MQKAIKNIFAPPSFPTLRENQNATSLNRFLWLILVGNIIYILSIAIRGNINLNEVVLSFISISGIGAAVFLLKKGYLTYSSWIILLAMWMISIPLLLVGENVLNVVIALYFILVIPAFALLPAKQHTLFTLILIGSLMLHFVANRFSLFPQPMIFITPSEARVSLIIMGIIATVLLFYVVQSLNKLSDQAERSHLQLIESNKKLQLESKVRQQIAESFRASEKQFRLLFSEAPVGMAALSLDGTFIRVNPALCKMYKYDQAELMQKKPHELIHPDWYSKTALLIEEAITNNDFSIEFEQHYICSDGGSLFGWVHVIIERDEAGEPYRLLSQVVDITARREAELALLEERALLAKTVEEKTADLRQVNVALREASMRKDEFLATMSHELRTPLNVILTRTQAMQMQIYGNITEKQAEALTGITDSSHHLLSLIKDILDVSKIASGEEKVDLTIQPINPIVHEAVSFIMPIASENGLVLEKNIEDDMFYINCDSRRIKQILTNLLSNAVKFTPKGGHIGISVRGVDDNKSVEICVEDSGIGISKADQERLFQPFTQIDSSLSRQFEGTGLGLSLVKQLAELHNGSVRLESESGVGSKFFVYLPRVERPLEQNQKTIDSLIVG